MSRELPHRATNGQVKGVCWALCAAAGGRLLHDKPRTSHRYIYLSCFRGSVFRLNMGLAEGEERGLMEDTQTQEKQRFREIPHQ